MFQLQLTCGPSGHSSRAKKSLGWGQGAESIRVSFFHLSSSLAAPRLLQSLHRPHRYLPTARACSVSEFIVKLLQGSSIENPGACPGFPWVPVVLGASSNQNLARFLRNTKGKQILLYLHPWHFRSWVLGPQEKHLQVGLGLGPERADTRGAGMRGADPALWLRLAPDSALASVGVSIATYTYTWHPATATTLCGPRPSWSFGGACGAVGAAAGAGEGLARRGGGAGAGAGWGAGAAALGGGVGRPHEARDTREQYPLPLQPSRAAGGTPEWASGKGKCKPRSRPFRTLLGASFLVDSALPSDLA